MANELFKVAGITTHNTVSKPRFTGDIVRRVKQFTKGGATRVDLVELPSPMTKVEALKYMLTLPEFASADDQALINDAIEDRTPKAPKVKVVKPKAVKPSLDAIKARGKKAVEAPTETEVPVPA